MEAPLKSNIGRAEFQPAYVRSFATVREFMQAQSHAMIHLYPDIRLKEFKRIFDEAKRGTEKLVKEKPAKKE
jgi:hypothetical protein